MSRRILIMPPSVPFLFFPSTVSSLYTTISSLSYVMESIRCICRTFLIPKVYPPPWWPKWRSKQPLLYENVFDDSSLPTATIQRLLLIWLSTTQVIFSCQWHLTLQQYWTSQSPYRKQSSLTHVSPSVSEFLVFGMLSSRNNTLILPGRTQSTSPVKPNFLQGCSTVHFPKLQYVLYIYFSKCCNLLAIEVFEYKVFICSSPHFPTTSLCAVSVTHR